MDYPKSDMVWVFVELRAPNGTRSFRGRVRHADFDAIVDGSFRKVFFALEDTHWPEPGATQPGRVIIVGRDAQWKGLTGTFHLPVRDIITIAPMLNSSDLFLPVAAPENALSRWEQSLLATMQTETHEGAHDLANTDNHSSQEKISEEEKER